MRKLRLPALLSLLAGLSACVVPVGPEWSDPQRNYPPTIQSASPAVGSLLTHDLDGGPLAVGIVLADQNTRDKLYVRWIIDYPPFVEGVTRVAPLVIQPPGGQLERPSMTFPPNCIDDHIASGFTNHRLMMAASDRPFANTDPGPTSPPDQPAPGYSVVTGTWQFEMDCP